MYKFDGRSYGGGFGSTEEEACDKACEDALGKIEEDVQRQLDRAKCPDECPMVLHLIDDVGDCEKVRSKKIKDPFPADPTKDRWWCQVRVEWTIKWACKPLLLVEADEILRPCLPETAAVRTTHPQSMQQLKA